MNIFNWSHTRQMQSEQKRQDGAAEYEEALAIWQIEHDADHHDFTIAQLERFRFFIRATNAGLDFLTLAFWQHRAYQLGLRPDDAAMQRPSEGQ